MYFSLYGYKKGHRLRDSTAEHVKKRCSTADGSKYHAFGNYVNKEVIT